MKALSIRQPWAWAILHLGKDIENRPRASYHTGSLLIHAGLADDPDGYAAIAEIARGAGIDPWRVPTPETVARLKGGIVGLVTMTGCIDRTHPAAQSPWFFGPYGYTLADARPLVFKPYRGQLGFFDVDETKVGLASRAAGQQTLFEGD